MKAPFDRASTLTIRPLSLKDWEAYRDFYKGLKNPQHYSGFLAGRDLDNPETYELLFHWFRKPFVLFGLWDQDRLVGQTSITLMNMGRVAHFSGSEIADEYRGLGLADTLYQARLKYLRDAGFDGPITMNIHPDNIRSQNAAARNGFVKTGERDREGYDILTFKG